MKKQEVARKLKRELDKFIKTLDADAEYVDEDSEVFDDVSGHIEKVSYPTVPHEKEYILALVLSVKKYRI